LDLFPDKDGCPELAIQSSKGRFRAHDHSFSLELDESHLLSAVPAFIPGNVHGILAG